MKYILFTIITLFSLQGYAAKFYIMPNYPAEPNSLQGKWTLHESPSPGSQSLKVDINLEKNWAHVTIKEGCTSQGCVPKMVISKQYETQYLVHIKAEIDYSKTDHPLVALDQYINKRLPTKIFILKADTGLFMHWLIFKEGKVVYNQSFMTRSYYE